MSNPLNKNIPPNDRSWKTFVLSTVLILGVISISILISWQIKQDYYLNFKDPHYSAFVNKDAYELKYDGTVVRIPGIGRAGSNRYEVEFMIRGSVFDRGGLQPRVIVSINGQKQDQFRTTIGRSVKKYTYQGKDSGITLKLDILREKGVKLRYVKIYYVKVSPMYPAGIFIPPLSILLSFGVGLLIIFLIPLYLGFREEISWILLLLSSLTLSLMLSFFRIWVTIITVNFLLISITLFLTVFLLKAILPHLFLMRGRKVLESYTMQRFAAAVIFFLGFKLFFVTYPSLISLDIGYHTRNLAQILNGNFHLTTVFPGDIYTLPYPPLFYLILCPFALVITNHYLLLKIAFAVIEIISPLLIAMIAHRLFGATRYALWAFIIYNIIPYSYRVISAGFVAEMFAQMLILLFILMIISFKRLDIKRSAILFLLTMCILLSHFGGLVKFYLMMTAFLLLFKRFRKSGISISRIILVVFLATLASYLVFYIHYNYMFAETTEKLIRFQSPVPEELQSAAFDALRSLITYIGKYFFIPSLLWILGLVFYFRKTRTRIVEVAGKKMFTIGDTTDRRTMKKIRYPESRSTVVIAWIIISYLIIFLLWLFTPVKTRHLPFLSIIISLFSSFFVTNIPTGLKRYGILIKGFLLAQFAYLLVIIHRLIFHFYRTAIN